MKQLSGLDATFLYMETPTTFGHVTGLMIFERPSADFDPFAAVYAKPLGRAMVDTFITEVSQDTWIYFPWDMGLAFQPPIAKDAGTLPEGEVTSSNATEPTTRMLIFSVSCFCVVR